MTDFEIRRLIKEADKALELGRCADIAYDDRKYFLAPNLAMAALERGLIEVVDGQLSHGKAGLFAQIQLTEIGRDFCGIKRLNTVEVKPKKKVERSLFD